MLCLLLKQKTAYEMRISDWSSDVCSSDLLLLPPDALLIGFGDVGEPVVRTLAFRELESEAHLLVFAVSRGACRRLFDDLHDPGGRWYLPSDLRALGQSIIAPECDEIGRAACRDRVCPCV